MSDIGNQLLELFNDEVLVQLKAIREEAKRNGTLAPPIPYKRALCWILIYLTSFVPGVNFHCYRSPKKYKDLLALLYSTSTDGSNRTTTTTMLAMDNTEFWRDIKRKIKDKLVSIGATRLEHALVLNKNRILTLMVQNSVMYPGFQFGCIGARCSSSECREHRRLSAACPIVELCGVGNAIALLVVGQGRTWNLCHRHWTVIAVTDRGHSVWLQATFELQFQHVDRAELPIVHLRRTKDASTDGECEWRFSPGGWSVFHTDSDYRSTLRSLVQHFQTLQQTFLLRHIDLPEQVIFNICEFEFGDSDPVYNPRQQRQQLTTIGTCYPDFIQMKRFMTLSGIKACESQHANLLAAEQLNLLDSSTRRAIKRKIASCQSAALNRLGTTPLAQICGFEGQIRAYAGQEEWRTAAQEAWVVRKFIQEIPHWNPNREVRIRCTLLSPQPHMHSIVAHIAWTESRSLFLFWISAFYVHANLNIGSESESEDWDMTSPILREQSTIQNGRDIARAYLNFLHSIGGIRNPESSVYYIPVPDRNRRDTVYQSLVVFLRSQQLGVYNPHSISN